MTEAVFVKNRFPQKNKTFYPLPMIKKADRFSLTQEFFPASMKSYLLFYDFQDLIQTILSYDINKAFSVDFRLFSFQLLFHSFERRRCASCITVKSDHRAKLSVFSIILGKIEKSAAKRQHSRASISEFIAVNARFFVKKP